MKQVMTAFPQIASLTKEYRVQFILDLANSYGKIDLATLDEIQQGELRALVEREMSLKNV